MHQQQTFTNRYTERVYSDKSNLNTEIEETMKPMDRTNICQHKERLS